MRRATLLTAAAAGGVAALLVAHAAPRALAHCEIPCGIYDDHARVEQMLEDTTTVGKAVDQIMALSKRDDALGANQLARWTVNKEEHATRIQHTIAQYFMTQRIKPVPEGSSGWEAYAEKLARHHAVIVAAMKTKQTVDPGQVEELRQSIERIAGYYPASGHMH